jgi:hypothetical protein
MKTLLIALTASYLVTWCSGIFIARQKSIAPGKARLIHLGLSLVTCTLLGIFFHLTIFG